MQTWLDVSVNVFLINTRDSWSRVKSRREQFKASPTGPVPLRLCVCVSVLDVERVAGNERIARSKDQHSPETQLDQTMPERSTWLYSLKKMRVRNSCKYNAYLYEKHHRRCPWVDPDCQYDCDSFRRKLCRQKMKQRRRFSSGRGSFTCKYIPLLTWSCHDIILRLWTVLKASMLSVLVLFLASNILLFAIAKHKKWTGEMYKIL